MGFVIKKGGVLLKWVYIRVMNLYAKERGQGSPLHNSYKNNAISFSCFVVPDRAWGVIQNLFYADCGSFLKFFLYPRPATE